MESNNQSSGAASEAAREASTQATAVASTAAEQAGNVASTAAEGGKWVAAVGQEQAAAVASTASEQVAQVAGQVGTQAKNLLEESKTQLRGQAQSQTEQIASKLRELGDQVQALVDGRTYEAGPVLEYAQQAGTAVTQFAGRLETRGFDGVVSDVQRFARRRPGLFLLGAAVAGFAVARAVRSNAISTENTSSPESDFSGAMGYTPSPSALPASVSPAAPNGAGITSPPAAVSPAGSSHGVGADPTSVLPTTAPIDVSPLR